MWFRLGQIDELDHLDAAVRGEPAHDGGVLDVHPLKDALRQLPVLGRLLKGGLSDSQVERIFGGRLWPVCCGLSHITFERIGACTQYDLCGTDF